MVAIADGGLCHLRDQRLRIPQQDLHQLAVALELPIETRARQSVGTACTLHDGPTRRTFSTHEHRDPDCPVIANQGDFSRRAVLERVKQGDDRVSRKEDVTDE